MNTFGVQVVAFANTYPYSLSSPSLSVARLCTLVLLCLCPLLSLAQAGDPANIGNGPVVAPHQDVRLVQIGFRSFPDGSHTPIWAVMLGNTEPAENRARFFKRLGPYSLNATLWTHESGSPLWVRTTYRRPQNADEMIAWLRDVEPFTSRYEGDASLLPPPFDALEIGLTGRLEFVIRYEDGTAKAYLDRGISQHDAEEFTEAVRKLTSEGRRMARSAANQPEPPYNGVRSAFRELN